MSLPETTLGNEDQAERLQRRWDEGRRPDLSVFLEQAGSLSAEALALLLRVDQRGRWRAGQRVPAEEKLVSSKFQRAEVQYAEAGLRRIGQARRVLVHKPSESSRSHDGFHSRSIAAARCPKPSSSSAST
jgi:hypothetical protein